MLYAYLLNCFLNIFLPKFKLKTKKFSYSSFSFLMQLYSVKCMKFLRTRQYSLEQKCEWNLSDCFWQLSHLVSIFLTVWYLHIHSQHWQHFQSLLSLGPEQIEHLPSCLPPHFFKVVVEAGCLQGSPIALMVPWVHWHFHHQPPLPFLLPQKSHTDIFDDYFYWCGCSCSLILRWFSCCQLGYFSIHSTNAFTPATWI